MTNQSEDKRALIRAKVEKFVSEAYWYEGEKNIVVEITDKIITSLNSQDVFIAKHGFYSDLMEPLIGEK